MKNTRYLPENFEQCRLEKNFTHCFPYNSKVRSSWNALIQDSGKNMKRLILLIQPFEKILTPTIIGLTRNLKTQGFDHK